MVSIVETQKLKIDRILWALVFALVIAAVGGNYYFSGQSLLLRVIGLLCASALALFIVFQTSKGRYVWTQWLEATQEVRKMYWPTRQETVQTTLAVLAMVLVMGVLLWTTDFILLRAVAWLTGHWGV